MDHLGLEDDQKEKLRQYTEFTHQHDYDVAVGTLASLNWNLEQAIEAHLMQEDMNDDDDPEILETVPTRASHRMGGGGGGGATSSSNGRGIEPEVVNIEEDEMPATRGRRRGRVAAAQDETTTVDNQIDDERDTTTSKRGAAVPRHGRRGQASEQSTSSSSATTSSVQTRRHTRSQQIPLHQEPAHPEPARQNGTTSSSSRAPMGLRNLQVHQHAPAHMIESDDDDDDVMAYDDIHEMVHQNRQNGLVDNNEVPPRETALSNGRVPMIPDNYSSVPDALRNFVAVFSSRFCSTPSTQAFMPPFYTDTLQNAVKEAFENPNSALRRPLVFYINNDRSIAANIFASQVLCSEAVSSLIRHQYVLFPWDISTETCLTNFLEFLQATNMGDVRNMIQRMAMHKIESFPMMVIVVRERNSYRLVDICRGIETQEQVLEKLLAGVEEYSNIRMSEASELRERQEREAIRSQQEAEYKASLEADKAKMEAKQREIEEQRLEAERRQKEIDDETVRRELVASTLPDEPAANSPPADIINVKFRLPEGGQDMRRFRRHETIQTLINYLSSKGFSPEKYKYFNSDFPKKEVTRHFDLSTNFIDSKWPAREQIFVEEI